MHQVIFREPSSKIFALYFRPELYFPSERKKCYPALQANKSIKKFLSSIQFYFNDNCPVESSLKVALEFQQQCIFLSLIQCLFNADITSIDSEFSPNRSIIDAMLLIAAQGYTSQAFGMEKLSKVNEAEQIITNCLAYIDENYMKALSITEITKRYGISKTVFQKMFPVFAGTTFKHYLTELRIEQAKRLAAIPDLPYSEIAYMVGYENFSTFYRNFRSCTGISPAQYRHKLLSKPTES